MKRPDCIRVLVIDDSAQSRRTITRVLRSSPQIEVVGAAGDGEEALRKTMELEPDLITLDLEMPKMDGFVFLRLVMAERPTPVIVISGRSGAQDVFKALDLGAADFVAKSALGSGPDSDPGWEQLIRKVHATRQLRIHKLRERIVAPRPPTRDSAVPRHSVRAVAIGASTGGPSALMHVLGSLATPPPCAFLVSQHMPPGFTEGFAQRLDRLTALRAREARNGDLPEPGLVLLAPGGHHLELETVAGRLRTRVRPQSEEDRYVPSVDLLFRSAAKHYGTDLLAVVLTGMGDDGREGVVSVKDAGGSVIAESEETAVVFGMPLRAARTGAVDRVLPLSEIADAIRCSVPRARTRGREPGP